MKVRSTQEHDAVAAYASLEGAERAVAHLVRNGYDEQAVGISPRDYEEVGRHPIRRHLGRWLPWGLAAGAGVAGLVALGLELGAVALVEAVVPAMAWGAVAGAVIGIVIASIAYRTEKAEAFLTQRVEIEPTRFEVTADQNPDQARNDLARWWDPAALPAGWDPRG